LIPLFKNKFRNTKGWYKWLAHIQGPL